MGALLNSRDLNPVDCSIWRALQQLVFCRRRIQDIEQLKEVLQTCWEQTCQDIINRAIGQFRKQFLLIAAGERHIEHHFVRCFRCYTYIIILTCFIVERQNLENKIE